MVGTDPSETTNYALKAATSGFDLLKSIVERITGPKSSATAVYANMRRTAEDETFKWYHEERIHVIEEAMESANRLELHTEEDFEIFTAPRFVEIEKERERRINEHMDNMIRLYEMEKGG